MIASKASAQGVTCLRARPALRASLRGVLSLAASKRDNGAGGKHACWKCLVTSSSNIRYWPLDPNRRPADASSHHRTISDSVPLIASSVMMSLSVSGRAMADEAVDAVLEAAPSGGLPFGLTPGEIALLVTPLAGFAIFKLIVQPKVWGAHAFS